MVTKEEVERAKIAAKAVFDEGDYDRDY